MKTSSRAGGPARRARLARVSRRACLARRAATTLIRKTTLPALACALVVYALVLVAFAPAAGAQSGRNRVARPVEEPAPSAPPRRPATEPSVMPQRPTGERPPRGRSKVSGRVVYEATGEPVGGARVRLSSRRGAGPAAATFTDARGEFRFEGLPAGDYRVSASPPGGAAVSAATFGVPLPSGDPQEDDAAFEAARREADPAGATVEVSVGDGGAAEVEVRVRRPSEVGGTVSGRVAYADGKPAERSQVILIRRDEPGRNALGPTRLTALADEKGRYRLDGVPPGEYLVRAHMQETLYRDQHGRTYGGLVVRAYHPAAAGASGAAPVHVEAGGELRDVDITLTHRPVRVLGGTLVARGTSRPLAGVHVRLRAKEDGDLPFAAGEDDRFGWTDAQGRFSFDNVADGDYVLSFGGVMSPEAPPPGMGPINRPAPRPGMPPRPVMLPPPGGRVLQPAPGRPVETRREVSVAGADVKNLVVEAATGGRVSGVVEVEGGGALPPRLLVMSEPAPGERRPEAVARTAPDGSFVLSGVPEGPLVLNVVSVPGYYVRSISVGGAETGGGPIYVADGAEVRDVRVVLSTATATLTGRVLTRDGSPRRGATVMLVPADKLGTAPRTGRLVGVTDVEGRFALRAGPGEYLAVVWAGRPPGSDDELRSLASGAPRVTLREGERTTLDLTAPADR
ncbi:MAG TPA: carboxypeptidase regulatory-like domain-containing protein [Pyrinomonadaceae bacterium]|nr:carboxypeptidase regulatory-like domain-containing protein [Pyrinomonadaceae bacterium]